MSLLIANMMYFLYDATGDGLAYGLIVSALRMSTRDLRSFVIRFKFDSAVLIQIDSKVIGRFKNFRISRACPLLKRLKPLMALCGAVYRIQTS